MLCYHAPVDWSSWLIVGFFLTLTFGLGVWFARRANQNTSEYFLSGRTLPWWVLGTSMVVTTFAPDTPLGVAEYARSGVYNGWFGWNLVMAQILAVFLFSRLWRRSGVLTDNELIELRYSGRPAAGLRLFKALHFSILANLLSLSLVINAIVTVLQAVLDVSPENMEWLRIGVAAIAVTYALIAGFWGVVATDFLQFWIAVIGTAIFAWIAADHLGGMGKATKALSDASLSFFPESGPDLSKILVYVGIMWWGMYNADGGGYLAQRMLAAK
ncbi:MAG TPA: sodium:proline symporter, partial [Planctomycetota bacterium]|nr:sodium:proline symporter [Planctomycetota bacterium]